MGESVGHACSWPVQLHNLLLDDDVPVAAPVIIAKTGWTTDELAAAIDQASPPGPFGLVTLQIGVNNQYRGRAIEEYRQQFGTLLTRATGLAGGRADHVVALSIPDWGVTPFAAREGRDAALVGRQIDEFNEANRELTRRAGARYVDITPFSRQAGLREEMLTTDGLHPSGTMYAEWARRTAPAARAALQDTRSP